MKAKIYVYELEGTPQEIVEFVNKIDKQSKQPNQYTYFKQPAFTIIGDPPSNPLDWSKITCSTSTIT
ncbi:hypothetical protein ACH6EH_06605 [Paenibacillus sp. JSM ZJ436]|uniref:hypothetical protein n=1 Tax=Paenibacillus sp. JSM ZJ436 TaxID=3376190 RepID=UPI0037B2E370